MSLGDKGAEGDCGVGCFLRVVAVCAASCHEEGLPKQKTDRLS